MRSMKQKLLVIKTLGRRLHYKSGQEGYCLVSVVGDTYRCGSHCTSNYNGDVHVCIRSIQIFRSEGPAQVFLIVLMWLITQFGSMSRDAWKKITIAYDNMCHLNNLKVSNNNLAYNKIIMCPLYNSKVARQPLPLSGDLKFIWTDVNKVIDDLHIKNHRDPSCHQKYSTVHLKKDNPHFNTMSCEQTFAWLSRHKHILCSMPKTHFHFYLHRMVKRRNKYISYCYSEGKRK